MDSAKILTQFDRTTEEIFSLAEFKSLLASKKPLRIKYGVDVTAPTLHIGHAVNLWMMRALQDLGHTVIFLIGDFTTRIGDPSGKSKTRPTIPQEDIERNTAAFIEQAKMVLRFDNPALLEIRHNAEWFDAMPTSQFLQLLSMITHARLISRDMFQQRIAQESEIYMHEMIYPVLQGYDSYMLESDLTIIGSDQLFNEMLGRFYQERNGQKPQVIITTKISPGIDGKEKQSKSLDNYIGLGHSPRDKFGRVMRIPDQLIESYFRLYTDVDLGRIDGMEADLATDPMRCKTELAHAIVARYHGTEVATEEQAWFASTFSGRKAPADMPTLSVSGSAQSALDIVNTFFDGSKSMSEIRRLFRQGAISRNEQKITDMNAPCAVATGDVFKVGKRTWFRVRLEG